MHSCEQFKFRLTLYLDNELDADEKRAIEAHLKSCDDCRSAYNRERRFLKGVQKAYPLHTAPRELRTRIEILVEEVGQRAASQRPAEKHHGAPSSDGRIWSSRRYQAVAAIVAVVLVVASPWITVRMSGPAQAATFSATAVDAHQRHLQGKLPLEVTTDVPAEISTWFTDKVPFTFKLPNYQEASGQDKRYRLTGARLVGFEGDYAGYVAYEMEDHPIGLVITSRSAAAPTGKHKISAKGIDFYYETIDGLKVITWSHRDLTYALVSDLDERGQESCMVCHQGAKDQDLVKSLSMWGGVNPPARERAGTGSPDH